jgi:hypothetical protein
VKHKKRGNPWARRLGLSARRATELGLYVQVFSCTDLLLYWASRQIRPRQCVYCHAPSQTLDHLVPLRRGGPHAMTNLVPACVACNSNKGSLLLHQWLQVTQRPVDPFCPVILALTIQSNTIASQLNGANHIPRYPGGFDHNGAPLPQRQPGRVD